MELRKCKIEDEKGEFVKLIKLYQAISKKLPASKYKCKIFLVPYSVSALLCMHAVWCKKTAQNNLKTNVILGFKNQQTNCKLTVERV